MGINTRHAAARVRAKSDSIDREIVEDRRRTAKIRNALMLGPPKSGKSTFLKQFKILSQGGCLSNAELADFRPAVYKHVLDSAQAIITYMLETGLECTEKANEMHCERIYEYKLDASPGSPQNPYFSPDIADAIHQLWKDPIMLAIMDEHLNNFDLMDNVEYFFDKVLTIGTPEYLPNNADALHVYQKNTDLTEVELTEHGRTIRIIDMGNQRGEKRKWLHQFDHVWSVMFCTSLSTYDQVLPDTDKNQLKESFFLLNSIINTRWFLKASVILFLNKIDVFKKKLPKSPLERHFPEYTGGDDPDKAVEYILQRFLETNRAGLSVYPHVTQATETTSDASMTPVFETIKYKILWGGLQEMVCV